MQTLLLPCKRLWCSSLVPALLLVVLTLAAPALAQNTTGEAAPQATAAEEARISTYFDATLEEIREFIDSREAISQQVKDTLSELEGRQQRLEQELRQIKGMARIVQGRPYETRGVLQDLKSLRKEIRGTLAPAEHLLAELNTRQDKIGLLATETDQPWTRELPSSLQDRLTGLKRALAHNEREIKKQQTRLSKALETITQLDSGAQESLASIEKALPGFWKRLLFSPRHSLLDPRSWKEGPGELGEWIADLPSFLRIQLPASRAEWTDWTGKVLVYWLVLLATLFFGLRRSADTFTSPGYGAPCLWPCWARFSRAATDRPPCS